MSQILIILMKIFDYLISSPKIWSKLIIQYFTALAGPQSWIAQIVLTKILKIIKKENAKAIDHIEDDEIIKEGDRLEKLPPTPEVIKKREENFKDLIEGKK